MLEPVFSAPLQAVPHVRHGFFTRLGGTSSGVYGTLNCGFGSNDDRTAVHRNRQAIAGFFGVDGAHLLTCHQIHSATAIRVDAPWTPQTQPKADAMVTTARGLALGALAADCAPVLFADREAGVIGAAHAGWRGALGGVLEATLDLMEQAGARRRNIVVAVGPCIGVEAYEVGPDFMDAFIGSDAGYARYFQTPLCLPEALSEAQPKTTPEGSDFGGSRPHFDLPRFVTDRCVMAGAGRVDNLGLCTYADAGRFFSYRRTTHARDPDYGRQMSAVMLV